jgi:hypothetical protein
VEITNDPGTTLGLQTSTSIFEQKIPARSAKVWYRQTDRPMFASKTFLLTHFCFKTGASSYIRHMPESFSSWRS